MVLFDVYLFVVVCVVKSFGSIHDYLIIVATLLLTLQEQKRIVGFSLFDLYAFDILLMPVGTTINN